MSCSSASLGATTTRSSRAPRASEGYLLPHPLRLHLSLNPRQPGPTSAPSSLCDWLAALPKPLSPAGPNHPHFRPLPSISHIIFSSRTIRAYGASSSGSGATVPPLASGPLSRDRSFLFPLPASCSRWLSDCVGITVSLYSPVML